MQRDAPVRDSLVSEALHGPGKSNGCCLDCCGAPPKEVDTALIEKDGGKWHKLSDGRVLEYFVYGSTNDDAKLLVQISGSAGTAQTFVTGGFIESKMKELNIRGIGVTVPGHAYSTVNVGRKIYEFGKDLEEVLKAEGVLGKKFWVEGTSYGTSHAMAIAHYFKECAGMHLQLPYLSHRVRLEEKIESKVTGSALKLTYKDLQSCTSCHWFCLASCLCNCLPSGDFPEFPDEAKYQYQDTLRSVRHSVYGVVFNATEDHVFDWGFDPREIQLKGESKVLISYAEDDQESPPEHGMWLVSYFEASANPGKGKGHDSFSVAMRKGEQVQLFHDLCISKNLQ